MESDELIENIEKLLDSCNEDVLVLSDNNQLKRYLHTLKGSVRMAGANKAGGVSHRLETLLDYSETRDISLFKLKPLIIEEMNKIKFLLSNINIELNDNQINWLDNNLNNKNNDTKNIIKVESNSEHISEVKNEVRKENQRKEDRQFIRIDSSILDNLINNAGDVRLTRTTLEGLLLNSKKGMYDLQNTSNKLSKMLKEIEVQAESQMIAKKELMVSDNNKFDPLEFDRFTRLQELTRFMSEALADVNDLVLSFDNLNKIQENTISQQAILSNGLLESMMKIRLLPLDSISERLYKITRNTAKELNKRVILELQGEKTEIDRLVLDKIISPLEHLLRNSIAHGIENSDDRLKKNKSHSGKVIIETLLDGNFILINIKDDGAGINLEKVKNIGLSKGLLERKNEYSEKEIVELIFKSGFSTADEISQVAGRGVGMDVVQKEILDLGGTINISTEKDKGTEFNIVIPVSVANNNVMLTSIKNKLIGIPTVLVEEIISLKKEDLILAYNKKSITIKNKEYNIKYLGHLLGIISVDELPEIKTYNSCILISYLNEQMLVHVDVLENTTEVLIKNGGVYLSKINGVLGATLLGDGRQGIIVNPILLKEYFTNHIEKLFTSNVKNKEIIFNKKPTVMVVDDSITVRRASTKILERNGFNVMLAKDGEDGLEQLQIMKPDIILSDIEMPKMDGFEFAKNIKNNNLYKNIPIIMITSRTADKHKSYAFSLGVEDFLGKPYQEDELVTKIKKLINKN